MAEGFSVDIGKGVIKVYPLVRALIQENELRSKILRNVQVQIKLYSQGDRGTVRVK